MKIKIGEQYINKTWRFLVPCLRGHGNTFVSKFNCLFKLAAGIHDTAVTKEENSIYIMLDKTYKTKKYKDFIKYIKNQNYFVKKYEVASEFVLESDVKHMVVIRVPKMFDKAYDKFLQGKYSEMYTKKELQFLFSNSNRKKEYEILSKTGDALNNFVKSVNEQFNTITNPRDFYDSEWELPLKKKEEIFNCENNAYFLIKK